jgi:long-subunit fatty acid transport protein
MLSRNASTSIDATYFNPAGLVKMENGWYFSLQNQMLIQTKTILSGYPLLNSSTYEGEITAPLFPIAYAVYKKDKFAFSFGFSPNSGGGSAEFNDGLPSFEKNISKLVPGLAGLSRVGQNVTGYQADIYFSGKSVYWGIQAGVSYKLNETFSVYGGLRYVPAENNYNGYIKDIEVEVNGQYKNASNYLTNEAAPLLTSIANQSTAVANSLQPLVTGGAGSMTLPQVQNAGLITVAQSVQIQAGLVLMGLTPAQASSMPVTSVQGAYNASAATLNGQSAAMTATGAQLKDKNVDVTQTGSGITPILGLNISPAEGLNIGMKYEFKTKLTLTNNTAVDGTGMFPDNAETGSDIPAIFTIGVDYKVDNKFNFSVSYNNYHDKGVNWGKNIYGEERTIEHNGWEMSFGGQYQIVKYLAFSMGYLRTMMGATEQFNSDFSFYSNSDTYGAGFEIKPAHNLIIDIGALITNYQNAPKFFRDADVGNYAEVYKKHNIGLALGLSYHFGGN